MERGQPHDPLGDRRGALAAHQSLCGAAGVTFEAARQSFEESIKGSLEE